MSVRFILRPDQHDDSEAPSANPSCRNASREILEADEADAGRRRRAEGISLHRLKELIRGKPGVTAATALRLAKLSKTSPEFWMNLQAAWDLCHPKHATAAAG